MEIKPNKKQVKISKVEITKDKISGRGGLFFLSKTWDSFRFLKITFIFSRFPVKEELTAKPIEAEGKTLSEGRNHHLAQSFSRQR